MAFEKRDKRVMTNLTEDEYQELAEWADRAGLKVSSYIRALIIKDISRKVRSAK